ncbi:MAG: HD domain-containing protein [Bacteroidales bacterium]|nr:HD domain-containing protein [Bacteroidales bacterium]
MTNKRKIINDPVHGFIAVEHPLVFDLLEHPYMQRLRHIKQVALGHYVYPGATHSRFHHALGAMHLLNMGIEVLRSKGHRITPDEAQAAAAAILLHDVGHGPFSHALEHSLAEGVEHETLSRLLMQRLNAELGGQLDMAMAIFDNRYHKRFLHQLISSQLDVDRLDYIRRDSFYTGVTEGTIGSERVIKMLNVVDDNLVIEAKGIYSIEKFLIARRLMYWQVYLHKTVVAAEQTLIQMLQRAKAVARHDGDLEASPALRYFLQRNITAERFAHPSPSDDPLAHFVMLDDADIMVAAKRWMAHPDTALATLAQMLVHRRLPAIALKNAPFPPSQLDDLHQQLRAQHPELAPHAHHFVFSSTVSIRAYQPGNESIKVLYNNGHLADIAEASDILRTGALSNEATKHFLCYPKHLLRAPAQWT